MSVIVTPTTTGHLAVCAACRTQIHTGLRAVAEHFRRTHVCSLLALRAQRAAVRRPVRPGGDVA